MLKSISTVSLSPPRRADHYVSSSDAVHHALAPPEEASHPATRLAAAPAAPDGSMCPPPLCSRSNTTSHHPPPGVRQDAERSLTDEQPLARADPHAVGGAGGELGPGGELAVLLAGVLTGLGELRHGAGQLQTLLDVRLAAILFTT